jgi:hypothetical protein
MKTIQEELGGVSQEEEMENACKIKTKNGTKNAKKFRKLSKCVV